MELKGEQISLVPLAAVALEGEFVEISSLVRPRIAASRKLIEQIIARDAVVYRVNTEFGKLSDVLIPQGELRQLQLNQPLTGAQSRITI
jgi:histidine ammonia-lyase